MVFIWIYLVGLEKVLPFLISSKCGGRSSNWTNSWFGPRDAWSPIPEETELLLWSRWRDEKVWSLEVVRAQTTCLHPSANLVPGETSFLKKFLSRVHGLQGHIWWSSWWHMPSLCVLLDPVQLWGRLYCIPRIRAGLGGRIVHITYTWNIPSFIQGN